jgi:hypothetical protein
VAGGGDHDLKPLKASGFSHEQHLAAAAEKVRVCWVVMVVVGRGSIRLQAQKTRKLHPGFRQQSAVKPLHQRILGIRRLGQLFTQQRRVLRLFRGLVRQLEMLLMLRLISSATALCSSVAAAIWVVMSVMLATASLMPTSA